MYKPHKKAKQKIESSNRAHKNLTAKGLPAAVIQLGEKTTQGRVKRALYGN